MIHDRLFATPWRTILDVARQQSKTNSTTVTGKVSRLNLTANTEGPDHFRNDTMDEAVYPLRGAILSSCKLLVAYAELHLNARVASRLLRANKSRLDLIKFVS